MAINPLGLKVPTLDEIDVFVRSALSAPYSTIKTKTGEVITAFDNRFPIFKVASSLTKIVEYLYAKGTEDAASWVPWLAVGDTLQKWLELLAITIPPEATAQVSVDVVASVAVVLPAGTKWSTPAGHGYTQDSELIFAGAGTQGVNLTAMASGAVYNMAIGEFARMSFPIDEVESRAQVTAVLVEGQDPANEEDAQALLKASLRAGRATRTGPYYATVTAGALVGVGEVYYVRNGGAGVGLLYPTKAPAVGEPPYTVYVPTAGELGVMQAAVDNEQVLGVTDTILILALVLPEIDFAITIVPNNGSTQAAATEALRVRFGDEYVALPGSGAAGYTIADSEILGAVTTAAGVTSATVTSTTAGAGATAENIVDGGVLAKVGQLLQLGTVVWS